MTQEAIRRKLLIVGDGACGKTSLLSVFAMGEFPSEYEPTVFENYVAEIKLDGKPVQLALWDTAGQEEYERLRPMSYAKSHVILIAFALDDPSTLDNVYTKWIEEVRSICGTHVPVILVGCKMDLRDSFHDDPSSNDNNTNNNNNNNSFYDDSQRKTRKPIPYTSGQDMAKQIGARAYNECSALHNIGVDDVFEAATRASMLVRADATGPAEKRRNSSAGLDGSHSSKCCVIL